MFNAHENGWIIIWGSFSKAEHANRLDLSHKYCIYCIMKPAMHSFPHAECAWCINFSANFNDIWHRTAHMKFWDHIIIAPTLSVTPTILVVNIYNVFDGLLVMYTVHCRLLQHLLWWRNHDKIWWHQCCTINRSIFCLCLVCNTAISLLALK